MGLAIENDIVMLYGCMGRTPGIIKRKKGINKKKKTNV
jgi:hypothetical protein